MKEYIEREAAIKAMDEDRKNYRGFMAEEQFIHEDAIEVLKKVPAADVRPVVLCRDCKHRFMTPNGWHCPYAEWGIEDDDFCSCGEKREES